MIRFYFATIIGVFVFVHPAFAQSTSFYIDPSYDLSGRTSITATERYTGVNSRWYVEDNHWNTLTSLEQSETLANIIKLSNEFDSVIYSRLRALFGSENTPGVDQDPKITVLVLKMDEEAGGYMREQDGFSKDKVTNSNAREMLYLNAQHLGNPRSKAFLAHEFQHIITFNQKFINHGVQEEVWLNELRSEIASTILGYDDPVSYAGSNLEARVKKFLKTPTDALLDWENKSKDYSTINLFGQYILDKYGRSVIAAMAANNKAGVESFNVALRAFGFSEDFAQVYRNWAMTVLINNCAVEPINTYCYKNPMLDYGNFRIQFNVIEGSGKEIMSRSLVKDWQADWLKLEKNIESERPKEHILMLQFFADEGSKFKVPYVVYDKKGEIIEISEMLIDESESGTIFVEDFGFNVPQVVIIPYNQNQTIGTSGSAQTTSYSFNATTIDEATREAHFMPPKPTMAEGSSTTTPQGLSQEAVQLPDLPDGSLIRAEGDYKVYIIKGGHKRWIQSADIFNFYSHLGFEVVSVLSKETVALYKDAWLVRAEGDFKVYEINGDGTRHWLDISAEEFNASGRLWDMVYTINKNELLWYREGSAVK